MAKFINPRARELGIIGKRLVLDNIDVSMLESKTLNSAFDVPSIEVKTQNRWIRRDGDIFTVNEDQYNTCLYSDYLVFVEYSTSRENYYINIWECNNRTNAKLYGRKNGTTAYGWKISEMTNLANIYDEKLSNRMRELSSSRFIK